ncbi:MAG: TonB family protein [Verrucomicrobiota bacterium]
MPCLLLGRYRAILILLVILHAQENTTLLAQEAEPSPQMRGTLPETTATADAPIPTFTVVPIYPRKHLLAGEAGSVILKYKVNPDGKIARSLVMQSTDPLFAEAAQHALQFWRFKPLIINDERSASVLRQTFSFRSNADSFYSLEALSPENSVLVPFPVKGLRPAYPEALREEQLQGHCDLIVSINRAGQITEITTENATHLLFAESGLLTAREWTFLPQTVIQDNQRVRLTFLFRP